MLMEPVKALTPWCQSAYFTCVSGLRRLEKTLKFLKCIHVIDLVLNYGSKISVGNWLQLYFYFIVVTGIVVSIIGMGFSSYVSGFRLKFSRSAL